MRSSLLYLYNNMVYNKPLLSSRKSGILVCAGRRMPTWPAPRKIPGLSQASTVDTMSHVLSQWCPEEVKCVWLHWERTLGSLWLISSRLCLYPSPLNEVNLSCEYDRMLNPVSSSESPKLEVVCGPDTPGNHSTSDWGGTRSSSFFTTAAQSSTYGCSYTLSLFNISPICGHLGSLQYFTINNASNNNLVYVYFYIAGGDVFLG